MFFYPTACIPAPASTQSCVILVAGLLPQGMKLNTLPSGVGIKNAQTCTFLSCVLGTWSLLKHRDKLTLSFGPHNIV